MPALVNSSVGSLPGIRELLGTTVWSLLAKKRRKAARMSALFMNGTVPSASGSRETGRDPDYVIERNQGCLNNAAELCSGELFSVECFSVELFAQIAFGKAAIAEDVHVQVKDRLACFFAIVDYQAKRLINAGLAR